MAAAIEVAAAIEPPLSPCRSVFLGLAGRCFSVVFDRVFAPYLPRAYLVDVGEVWREEQSA
ncbi:MAG: hypothetical protein AAF355_01915 [Myxococcota bacterium]